MTVFLDDHGDRAHLVADSLPELEAFARRLGLRPAWRHETPGMPHYDLTTRQAVARAVAAGAVRVSWRELPGLARRMAGGARDG